MKKPVTLAERIQKEKEYIAFLEKRLASDSFRQNESAEVFEQTRLKLKKAKLVLKCLETGKGK
jgi:hypothetical protein